MKTSVNEELPLNAKTIQTSLAVNHLSQKLPTAARRSSIKKNIIYMFAYSEKIALNLLPS